LLSFVQLPGASSLLKLPTELVGTIASFLSSDDLFNFRRACRKLKKDASHVFTQRHFRTKQFYPSYDGLSALKDISKSDLAKYCKTLILGPQVPFLPHPDLIKVNVGYDRSKAQCLGPYKLYYDQKISMVDGCQDISMLKTALTNLKKCEKLEVRSYSESGYSLSCGNFNDALPSHGEATFKRITKVFTMPYDDDTNVVDSLFDTVLHAALLAKALVRSIVFDSPYDQFDPYDPPLLRQWASLLENLTQEDKGANDYSLARLEHLELCVRHHDLVRWTEIEGNLVRLFDFTPKIEKLGLNFKRFLRTSMPLTYIGDSWNLGTVKTLDLSNLFADKADMIGLIKNLLAAKINHVQFRNVQIGGKSRLAKGTSHDTPGTSGLKNIFIHSFL